MHTKTIRPGLTAATTAGRALLAAGWKYDSTTPMADDTTIRTLLHPTGREIHARTVDRVGDDTTTLTLTGLDLTQVAGAISGAGLVEPAESTGDGCPKCGRLHFPWCAPHGGIGYAAASPAAHAPEPDYWLALADDLCQLADRLVTLAGTTPPVKAQLQITGAYPGNTDRSASAVTDAVAAALGVSAYSHAFPAGDSVYKADRDFGKLHAQAATYLPPEQSELERLRAENARLQAALAEGGTR